MGNSHSFGRRTHGDHQWRYFLEISVLTVSKNVRGLLSFLFMTGNKFSSYYNKLRHLKRRATHFTLNWCQFVAVSHSIKHSEICVKILLQKIVFQCSAAEWRWQCLFSISIETKIYVAGATVCGFAFSQIYTTHMLLLHRNSRFGLNLNFKLRFNWDFVEIVIVWWWKRCLRRQSACFDRNSLQFREAGNDFNKTRSFKCRRF